MSNAYYSGAPSADDPISIIRFTLSDTDENNPLITDSELEYILSIQPSLRFATAAAAGIIAGKFAMKVDTSIGQTRISLSQKYEQWKDFQQKLLNFEVGLFPGEDGTGSRTVGAFAGGTSCSERESLHGDNDKITESFSVGQDDFYPSRRNKTLKYGGES